MGIDLTDKLVETAQKVVTTYNEYNDIQYGATTTTNCLYRDISSFAENANREEVQLDGILWFDSTETVARGDIYYHPSEGYLQIVNITRAKTLVTDDTLQFIKCGVIKQRQIS